MYRLMFIGLFLLWSVGIMAQRKLTVASLETKTPQRDIKVRIDNGPEITTPWNGEFEVPDSFKRIDFSHPKFQRRYVLYNEVRGDTIYLIPIRNAINEVVIYGKDRRKDMMANIMQPAIPKEPELPQVVPPGPDVIALLMWTWDHTFGPKVEARHKRKQALKKVRAQEQEYEAKWEALKAPPKKKE